MSEEHTSEKIEVEAPQKDVETSNLDDIIQDMVGETPEVQQHVVDAEKARREQKEVKTQQASGKRDSAGNIFDPSVHMVDDNGEPRLTIKGRFRKIPAKTRTLNTKDTREQEKAEEHAAMLANSQVAAETVQGLKRQAYDVFLGYSADEDRHKMHVEATKAYFVEKGGVTLSPLHTLVMLEGAMLVEAVRTEKGQEKVQSIKGWLAQKWVSFKFRKKGKKDGTRSDSGANNVGKDNGGNTVPSKDTGSNGKAADRSRS